MSSVNDDLSAQLKLLPKKTGVYQFYDLHQKLLYIGKAKNLKSRVNSYFSNDSKMNGKTRIMSRKIREIKFTVVETEMDAFFLENSLIKKYQPKYNIQLKDDKSFPSICIKNERFPRIFPTRRIVDDGSEYFGPFTPVKTIDILLDLIKNIYPIRTCSYDLSESNITTKKFSVCLEYQIGNCLGPCEGKQSIDSYDKSIASIKKILKGNSNEVINELRIEMQNASIGLNFERAHKLKENLIKLEKHQNRSTVVNPKLGSVQVFTILNFPNEKIAYVNFLELNHGSIIKAQTIEVTKKLDESDETILESVIQEVRNEQTNLTNQVFTSVEVDLGVEIQLTVPQKGDKYKLIELSLKNASFYRRNKMQMQLDYKAEKVPQSLLDIKSHLQLKELPIHIECIDNSNFQGSYPVSAVVVFKNGKPTKKDYRHFNIKTVIGPDDFSSMEEVVYRRYSRMLKENPEDLPQLLVIDGGKGQLSASMKSLKKLKLDSQITCIGIAKRLEEIYLPGDTLPIYMNKKSDGLRLLQFMRDEAHRFGITFHRNKRDKGTLNSELTDIKGIGPTTLKSLLTTFKSVDKIKKLSQEELIEFLGQSKGTIIYSYFHKKTQSD
ncbi:MAG: excinuclease ABC subunit C [Sphingobacteriales bacterium]|jgi:excinuclease ABC subunit C